MECCRAEYELSARQGDGASLRTHLLRLAENTGKSDPRLHIAWPPAGRAVWDVYRSLSRPPSMGGAAPISMQEIAAYQAVYQLRLNPWELEMIQAFDSIALEILNKQ